MQSMHTFRPPSLTQLTVSHMPSPVPSPMPAPESSLSSELLSLDSPQHSCPPIYNQAEGRKATVSAVRRRPDCPLAPCNKQLSLQAN